MVAETILPDDWRFPQLSRVVHNVNTARKLDKFTDVTFIVGTDGDVCTIRAHRVVLGTANAELAKLVSGSDKHLRIWIQDVSPKGFKNLIRFLYDIDVKFSDLPTVRETLIVAEKYKVNKLRLAAENYLNYAVKYGPILEMLEIALEFKMPKLQSECIDIISIKYQDVLKSEKLASSPFEVVHAVLSIRPCCAEECQSQALLAIGKWQKKHPTDRKRLEDLLKCVDFTLARTTFDAKEKDGGSLLSSEDIMAFEKYKVSKNIRDAPIWYQSSKYALEKEDSDTEAEEKATPKSFSENMKLQKEKVLKTCDGEVLSISELMRKAADETLEFHKNILNQTVQEVVNIFSDTLREGTETALERFVDELGNEGEMNREKIADVKKESIIPLSEVSSVKKNLILISEIVSDLKK